MKTVKMKTFLLLSIIALSFLFLSCEKDSEITGINENDQLVKTIADNGDMPMDYLDLILDPELSEFSIDQDLQILQDGIPVDSELESMDGKGVLSPKLRFLFDKLNLSKEQMRKLHYAFQKYNKCRFHLFVQLKKLNHEIIKKANDKKHELLKKYKAGQITEAQLKQALHKLKLHTKYLLKNNPARKQIIVNLHKCHKEFIENIRLILTKEQWAMWVKWHKKGGKGK